MHTQTEGGIAIIAKSYPFPFECSPEIFLHKRVRYQENSSLHGLVNKSDAQDLPAICRKSISSPKEGQTNDRLPYYHFGQAWQCGDYCVGWISPFEHHRSQFVAGCLNRGSSTQPLFLEGNPGHASWSPYDIVLVFEGYLTPIWKHT